MKTIRLSLLRARYHRAVSLSALRAGRYDLASVHARYLATIRNAISHTTNNLRLAA